MITREQVADLREGDVVELRLPRWPEGTRLAGPLVRRPNGLHLADELVQWSGGDDPRIAWMLDDDAALTVISRAPRPLYVNHPRTEPVAGDVVREEDPDGHTVWLLDSFQTWQSPDSTHKQARGFDWPLRLLVDGETGQVVP